MRTSKRSWYARVWGAKGTNRCPLVTSLQLLTMHWQVFLLRDTFFTADGEEFNATHRLIRSGCAHNEQVSTATSCTYQGCKPKEVRVGGPYHQHERDLKNCVGHLLLARLFPFYPLHTVLHSPTPLRNCAAAPQYWFPAGQPVGLIPASAPVLNWSSRHHLNFFHFFLEALPGLIVGLRATQAVSNLRVFASHSQVSHAVTCMAVQQWCRWHSQLA